MEEFVIYYQHPRRVSPTEISVYGVTAKATRESFERDYPHVKVLYIYPKASDPAFNPEMHHGAEFWEAETQTDPA